MFAVCASVEEMVEAKREDSVQRYGSELFDFWSETCRPDVSGLRREQRDGGAPDSGGSGTGVLGSGVSLTV
jgi:hypothetical protein